MTYAFAMAAVAVLQTLSGKIYGTLELPDTNKPCPVVLIIAGSGPTDRNGNSTLLAAPNDSLKMLAEALRTRGIASLRYDKRLIGESKDAGPKEADLRLDHYIADAAGWVTQLQADKRFSRVYIAGHSEGALIGLIAAQSSKPAGYISIAGIGRPFLDVLDEQIQGKLPPSLEPGYKRVVASLREGKTVSDPPGALAALFRPSVQPYLISEARFDPVKEIGKLKMPVLIVQGTTDIQVKVLDAKLLSGRARRTSGDRRRHEPRPQDGARRCRRADQVLLRRLTAGESKTGRRDRRLHR